MTTEPYRRSARDSGDPHFDIVLRQYAERYDLVEAVKTTHALLRDPDRRSQVFLPEAEIADLADPNQSGEAPEQ